MRALALFLTCAAAPAAAQDFALQMPIDCTLGDSCYIQNYVDHDPSEAAATFQCGSLTYDGHKGTDFGLPSLAAMHQGVDVLAAAAGTVRGVRNDMRDMIYSDERAGEINGRDCGNGLVIAHGDGWETQYCHMQENSVTVLPGDQVQPGDVLGLVGLSGKTQFPHVHISLRRDGLVVDPFAPDGSPACDDQNGATLWDTPLATPQGGILALGFSNGAPDYADVKAGTAAAQTLPRDAQLVLWTYAFGARADDILELSIDGPSGNLLLTEDIQTRNRAVFMRFGGLNPPSNGWPTGTYTGSVVIIRNGVEQDSQSTTFTFQ